MSDRPGIELNTVQLVASMAAAVTGAVLTSYMGDGGTIIGTAVGSGASTAGFAVYKHYLVRTKEKVAPVIVEHARQWTPAGTVASDRPAARPDAAGEAGSAGQANEADATRVDRASDWQRARQTAPGWAEPTRAEPGWGPDVTRQDRGSPDVTRLDMDPARPGAAPRNGRYDGSSSDGPAHYGTVQLGTGPGGPGRHGGPGRLSGRPRWVAMTASAAVVFIVVMIGITLVELGTGKPIDATVWNRSQSGTTLGGSHVPATATPSGRPTPAPSGSAPGSTGATSGVQSSVKPTTGPTPTPSSAPTAGSTPTVNAPASVRASAPGGTGQARNATALPGQ